MDRFIRLNFEHLKELDEALVNGYASWVEAAPEHWKADGFLLGSSPIIVTSRYGQNSQIAVQGNELQEAENWQSERDYSKIAFLTVAIATSIQYGSQLLFIRHICLQFFQSFC